MASHGHDTDADEVQRSKGLIVMWSKTRKAQCTTLYVCDSIKEKCSQSLRSILGVLPWARTKNEYTMDDFPMLTIREPWLLKRVSTSNASAWLAGKGSMLQGRRDSRQGINSTEISKGPLWRKGRLITEFHNFLYERWLQAELQNRLAHTFTYFANLGFWQLIVLKVQYFSSWCDAYACEDTMHRLVRYGAHDAR
jgi:hypothetical protein